MNAFTFAPHNPIPLVSEEMAFRNGAKEHAKELDQWLGFKISETEELIRTQKNSPLLNEKETWNHISPQIFQTSYLELRLILATLLTLSPKRPLRLTDLGAAYYRIEFVNKLVFQNEFQLVGYEVCEARVTESKRVFENFFKKKLESLFVADVISENFKLPSSDAFFVYDFGTTHDIEMLFQKLIKVKEPYLLVARGARVKNILVGTHKNHFNLVTENQNYGIWNFQ